LKLKLLALSLYIGESELIDRMRGFKTPIRRHEESWSWSRRVVTIISTFYPLFRINVNVNVKYGLINPY